MSIIAFTETRAIIAYDGECMRPFSYVPILGNGERRQRNNAR